MYGSRCTWWGRIQDTFSVRNLPCCPHCKCPLFEMTTEEAWIAAAKAHGEKVNDPLYHEFIKWSKGMKCGQTYAELRRRFDRATEL